MGIFNKVMSMFTGNSNENKVEETVTVSEPEVPAVDIKKLIEQ